MYILGQILGFVAIALGILAYQMKTLKQLLFIQMVTAFVFCVHYLLIGAISGMAMNVVSLVRCIFFFRRKLKGKSDRLTPIIFTVITAIVGIISWNTWYSVFVFLGLVTHAFCMSLPNPQSIRKSILITSPLVMIYDGFAHSYGGLIYEAIAVASALVGIIRYGKKKKAEG